MQKADMSNDENSPLSRFHMGTNFKAQEFLGVHEEERGGTAGTVCRVWAPNAKSVSVVGNFNGWEPGANPMEEIGGGVWECFLPFLMKRFDSYKFCMEKQSGSRLFKSDPYAYSYDIRKGNASRCCGIGGYPWKDAAWMRRRAAKSLSERPVNIYELHPGSWRRDADGNAFSYGGLAKELVPYVKDMGYTHVELTPVSEYPYDASCGFGTTGYFAPTSRYGEPRGFMDFVEQCHEAGVGVILDWAPACFPEDEYGLARFDGTPCYEYADSRKAKRREKGALVFDFGRGEVMSFLISSAVFWLEEYHVDGLRVCDVASMLYFDGGSEREAPNRNDGNENLEAVAFLQRLNEAVSCLFPDVMMIAGESDGWPMVSRPVRFGGLGFGYKWNTGWRDGILRYLSLEPVYRKFNHDSVIFPLLRAFCENYILPLSHGGAVRGARSLLSEMPGEEGQKFAGVRLMLCLMTAHPGKKLIFMGAELGLRDAWDWEKELDWSLLEDARHEKHRNFTRDLNRFYLDTPPLWEVDFSREGFAWISGDDWSGGVLAFRRIGRTGREVIAVCNFLPEKRENYRVGVPCRGVYSEIFSSDLAEYGGSGVTNGSAIASEDTAAHGFDQSVGLTLPPLSAIFLKCRRRGRTPGERRPISVNGTGREKC